MLRQLRPEDNQGTVIELPSERDMARGFRRWLKKAGVHRAELHSSSRTRKAITFHDLRATGLTWMAVRGDDPLKIMQRAGHTDFKTTQLYVREAEAVRQGFGDVFPPLPESVLNASSNTPTDDGEQSSRKSLSARILVEQTSRVSSQESQAVETIAGRTGLETADGQETPRETAELRKRKRALLACPYT